MTHNTSELPHNCVIFLILLDKVQQFIVCDCLLVLVLIDLNSKLDVIVQTANVGLVVGNAFDNAGTEPLAILLSVHEESAS
jgi:hypothetical protein